MACSYDTKTVLEMIFDIARIMALITTIEYAATQIAIVVVVIVSCTKRTTTRSLFNLYIRSAKC